MDDQLLIRFLTHKQSPEDLKAIDRWINQDKANADWLFEMERIWILKDELRLSDEELISRSYKQFLSRKENSLMPLSPKRRKRLFAGMKYAAAIVLILLSLYIYHSQYGEYTSAINMIETRKGERASITLSDGTKVWLNADTKLIYPSQFGRKKREVTLEGEGYFEVAKEEKKPFVLNGKAFNIHVLGTQFNVNAYPGEDVGIALKEGKINVEVKEAERQLELNPSDHLSLTADGKTILQTIDVATINSWTKDEFIFVAQPLSAILRSLERRFNVPIILEEESLSSELFNCRAQKGTGLPDILELLRGTKNMSYRVNNDSIIITKN
ncbi:MAG: FecR domain-containing protein [Tannerellaceae bacterium]|jgi:ferric-dicitrate binding protein FerR (iron transport regulator)|nr:FecR domain-containing protein [Tannerellaceae bacterium]